MALMPTRTEYLLDRLARIQDPATRRALASLFAALDPSFERPPVNRPRTMPSATGDLFETLVFNIENGQMEDTARLPEDNLALYAETLFSVASLAGVSSLELVVQLPPELILAEQPHLYAGNRDATNQFGAIAYDPIANTITYTFDTTSTDYLNLALRLAFLVQDNPERPLPQTGAEITAVLLENGEEADTARTARVYPTYPDLDLQVRLQDMNQSPPAQMLILKNDTDPFFATASVTFPAAPPLGALPVAIRMYGGFVESEADIQVFLDGQDVTNLGTPDLQYGFLPAFTFNQPIDLTGHTLAMRIRTTLDLFNRKRAATLVTAMLDLGGYLVYGGDAIAYPAAGPEAPWIIQKRLRRAGAAGGSGDCGVYLAMNQADEVIEAEVVVKLPESGNWTFQFTESLPPEFLFVLGADGQPVFGIFDAQGREITAQLDGELVLTSGFRQQLKFEASLLPALYGQYVYFRMSFRRNPAVALASAPMENFASIQYGKMDLQSSSAYLYAPGQPVPVEPCPRCDERPVPPCSPKPCKTVYVNCCRCCDCGCDCRRTSSACDCACHWCPPPACRCGCERCPSRCDWR